jgi:hypothetical protein
MSDKEFNLRLYLLLAISVESNDAIENSAKIIACSMAGVMLPRIKMGT